MGSGTQIPEIGADDFARRFAVRAPNLMWFLGAGASASAGIPTAGDMIWEFKQTLYVSQRRASPQAVADLAAPGVRDRLQAHIDSLGNMPSPGDDDEYAALFEAVYPVEADRRTYLDAKIAGAKPSYGHIALATLMRAKLTRLLWTTNFDPLVADACAKVYDGTGYLSTVDLDAPDLARQCIDDGRWPLEVKLHGDFRSRRLKNTSDELRLQDERLRQLMLECCRRFALVIVGYSGRDSSIMDTLEEAVKQSGSFPAGLFWLHRGDAAPHPKVSVLLAHAAVQGKEAALVRVENFDEVMRDLVRLRNDLDAGVLDKFASERKRWSGAPSPSGHRGWPVVRLNALPVTQIPTVCRRIVCTIGGYPEMHAAVESAKVDVLVARRKVGVLGFGADADMRTAFSPYGITAFDLHTIERKRLRYDSAERGLLREALTRGIVRHRGLTFVRRGNADLLVPSAPTETAWAPLRKLVGALTGTIRNVPDLTWYEGIGIRLEWAQESLWLVVEPRTVFGGITEENRGVAADFARERTVKRYNRQLNDLIAFWARIIAGDGGDIRALGVGDGVDAVFRLSPDTAFSRRAGA